MRPLKIFIVDDDDTYSFLTKKTIATTAYESSIDEFSDGKAAIDYLHEIATDTELLPDIILLDLSMPVMDGWDFLNEYAQLLPTFSKRIKLYLVSSSISPYDIERAKNIPIITEFIIKPLLKDKLIALFKAQFV